jgi:hypothetical protein
MEGTVQIEEGTESRKIARTSFVDSNGCNASCSAVVDASLQSSLELFNRCHVSCQQDYAVVDVSLCPITRDIAVEKQYYSTTGWWSPL